MSRPYLPALSKKCLKAVACLYTADAGCGVFVIDVPSPIPTASLIASPLFGTWVQTFPPPIGEALARNLRLDGRSRLDLKARSVSAASLNKGKGPCISSRFLLPTYDNEGMAIPPGEIFSHHRPRNWWPASAGLTAHTRRARPKGCGSRPGHEAKGATISRCSKS